VSPADRRPSAAAKSVPRSRPRTAASNQNFIREQVKSYILANDLHPGDLLPTEQQLMEQLGVGRHPLREAMKALEAVGIVEIRHGYGTYVGGLSLQSLEDGLLFRMSQSVSADLRDVRNLLDVREALEVGIADRLIEHYQGSECVELTKIVETMEEKASRGEPFPEQDLEFHRCLYQPLDNELIIDLLGVFWRTFSAVNDQLPGPEYTHDEAAGWHRALLEALKRNAAGEFTQAMKDHFTGIRTRLDESAAG
jgi:DNA-binding FadR family transcriptional regulator